MCPRGAQKLLYELIVTSLFNVGILKCDIFFFFFLYYKFIKYQECNKNRQNVFSTTNYFVSEGSAISTQWLLLVHLAKGNVRFYHHSVVFRSSSGYRCSSLFLLSFYYFFNQNFLCPSIYYLKTEINLKQ
jgi:hypothetical protein